MGSPYLKSNESIILSTNNVVVNTVPAEAILTNERLMLVDSLHGEVRPLDIPFSAIETVTIGENSDADPVISLSLVTGPGVTQTMGVTFPQPPRMRRVAERDEWAARIKELSIVSGREGARVPVELSPPWIPGPLFEEGTGGEAPEKPATQSPFRNPPLTPRKPRDAGGSKNRTVIAAAVIVVILVALAAGAYLLYPTLLGKGAPASPVVTPVPTATAATPAPTTVATARITPQATASTPVPTPQVLVPQTGVWIKVTYDGRFSGTAGAPGRYRDIADAGDHIYQLSVKDEMVYATIQKQDNTGSRLTVAIYQNGAMIRTGTTTAPKGTVSLTADLRTT
jgi:hypothetical protein